jgi:hypothetical protein
VTVNTGCGESQLLEVYGIDGRLTEKMQVSGQTTLDTSRWPRGVYILRSGSRTAKLIVK